MEGINEKVRNEEIEEGPYGNVYDQHRHLYTPESSLRDFNFAYVNFSQKNFALTCLKERVPTHKNKPKWILKCGATDAMTCNQGDFILIGTTNKQFIQTASGELVKVEGERTINILPNIKLKNCLFVPKLSHKLLSISQLTSQLNCTVLMRSNCYVIQGL